MSGNQNLLLCILYISDMVVTYIEILSSNRVYVVHLNFPQVYINKFNVEKQ